MGSFKLLKFALLLCAIATLVFGGFAAVDLGRFFREAVSAEGTVVRLDWRVDTRRVRSSSGYQAVVRFTKAGGIPEEFVDENGYDPPMYSIGEKVQVLYDPADPANAKIDDFRSLWFAPVLLLLAGGLMLWIFATIHAHGAARVAAVFRACAARLRAQLPAAKRDERAGAGDDSATHTMDTTHVQGGESHHVAAAPQPEAGRNASAAGALRAGRIALAPGFKSRIVYYAPAWGWPFLLLFVAQGNRAAGGTGLDSKVSLAVFFLCNIPAVIGWLKGRLPWMEMAILWWIAPFLIWAALVLQM